MWQSLRLRSLGVISEAEVEFGPGLTVITGETGAGKTMVVSALALLRGQRASSSMIRRGTDQARIEASILLKDPELIEWVRDAGGEVEDELILARVLSPSGRSRAIAGGATVPAGLLNKVTDRLVAVHGQSDQQRLVNADQQRIALDRFAGEELSAVLTQFGSVWAQLQRVTSELDALKSNSVERLQRLDLLRYGLDEIARLEPTRGEDQNLKTEENRLAHAESLVRAATGAAHLLADAEVSISGQLATANSELQTVAAHDPDLENLAKRLDSLRIEADDIASDLHAYGVGVEVDPQRLNHVQERRSELGTLQRKYGPSLDDVLDWADAAIREIDSLDVDEAGIETLESDAVALAQDATALATRISELRVQAAQRLGRAIEAELADLALDKARVEIKLSPTAMNQYGTDRIEFLFAANSGAEVQPLGQGVSGGELSRLMLAIEVVLADKTPVPTLVFDEVDAGIGGRTAVEVGRKLARLASNAQIIVVTHLPQVAAFADSHFVVTKNDNGEVTQSSVNAVDQEERVQELARMLSGLEDSETALAHARELLETSRLD